MLLPKDQTRYLAVKWPAGIKGRRQEKSNNRFELAIAFLKDANQAEKYAQQENTEGVRDFLKKIGSNFRITERTFSFSLKNAWIIAEKYHAEAQRAEAIHYEIGECVNWRRG